MTVGTGLTAAAMLLSGCVVVLGEVVLVLVLAESGVERETGSEDAEGLRIAVKSAADEERCIGTTEMVACPTKSIPYRGVNHPLGCQKMVRV